MTGTPFTMAGPARQRRSSRRRTSVGRNHGHSNSWMGLISGGSSGGESVRAEKRRSAGSARRSCRGPRPRSRPSPDQRTVDLACTKYSRAPVSYDGVYRVETLPVPREALREGAVNAVIHRDYAMPTPIQILNLRRSHKYLEPRAAAGRLVRGKPDRGAFVEAIQPRNRLRFLSVPISRSLENGLHIVSHRNVFVGAKLSP